MVPENKTYHTSDKTNRKIAFELLALIVSAIAVFFISAHYDILEKIVQLSRSHEKWEIDEFFSVSIFLLFAFVLFSIRRLQELSKSKSSLLHLNRELQDALSEIKQLRGIIPICSSCKKIRDDTGYWHQVESYIHDRTDVEFSHGICPDCVKKLYLNFASQAQEEEKPTETG